MNKKIHFSIDFVDTGTGIIFKIVPEEYIPTDGKKKLDCILNLVLPLHTWKYAKSIWFCPHGQMVVSSASIEDALRMSARIISTHIFDEGRNYSISVKNFLTAMEELKILLTKAWHTDKEL